MAKQIKVREDNYFAVQGWMVTELKLKGKTIVSWETGKTAPKMEKAQELSDLYGIPLAYMDFSKAGNSTPLRERESEPQIPAF